MEMMNPGQIKREYGLPYVVAEYLSRVSRSKDFKEYENHKRTLEKFGLSGAQLSRARRCLVQVMEI